VVTRQLCNTNLTSMCLNNGGGRLKLLRPLEDFVLWLLVRIGDFTQEREITDKRELGTLLLSFHHCGRLVAQGKHSYKSGCSGKLNELCFVYSDSFDLTRN
jgi:hypothetical protein